MDDLDGRLHSLENQNRVLRRLLLGILVLPILALLVAFGGGRESAPKVVRAEMFVVEKDGKELARLHSDILGRGTLDVYNAEGQIMTTLTAGLLSIRGEDGKGGLWLASLKTGGALWIRNPDNYEVVTIYCVSSGGVISSNYRNGEIAAALGFDDNGSILNLYDPLRNVVFRAPPPPTGLDSAP